MNTQEPETPELDKLKRARDELGTQHIGRFLEFTDYVLCEVYEDYPHLVPTMKTTQDILMEYAGVDPQQVERERRMLMRRRGV